MVFEFQFAQVLVPTRCSYLPEEKFIGRRGKSIFGVLPVIVILFIVTLIIIAMSGSQGKHGEPPLIKDIRPDLAGMAVLFGAAFIGGGWLEFQLMQTIDGIPTAKIDAAAEGLSEINADFIPEKGQALISLMSKQRCVFYETNLEQYIHSGKSSHWEGCGGITKGIPTLMTDGTGYLAVPLYKADINIQGRSYYPVNTKGEGVKTGMPEGKALMSAFQNGMTGEDLSALGLKFETYMGGEPLFKGNELRITEIIIPTENSYFVMGRVASTAGTLGGKPVKIMDYDKATRILTVRSESKSSIEKTDKRLSFASFAFGALLLLGGLAYFGLV